MIEHREQHLPNLLSFMLLYCVVTLPLYECHMTHINNTRLGRLNIDRSTFTITGFSTGAGEAIQFHFAHSSKISGVGVFGAPAYLYAVGNPRDNFYAHDPYKSGHNYTDILRQIDEYEREGKIDPTRYLGQSRIYMFQGMLDNIAHFRNAEVIRRTYEHYGVKDIQVVLNPHANHGVITNNVGGPCPTNNPLHFLTNDCKYDGVYEMYNYLYGGNLKRPPLKSIGTVILRGEFFEFDQSSFFGEFTSRTTSMDTVGFIYIPSGCKSGVTKCKVSFALHGCIQSRVFYGDKFPKTSGYLEVAELNNIVIVFPQAYPYLDDPINPPGCWDWWGFLPNHGTKLGPQETILKRMMDRIFDG